MAGPAPTTIIKSVTLLTGEKFVLPPGAKLIGASDPTLITSTCPIPPLEPIGCFIAFIGTHSFGNFDEAYMLPHHVFARGYRFNGVDTLFPSEIQHLIDEECISLDTVGAALLAANIGIIQVVPKHHNQDSTDQVCVAMLLIQTVPSVANNLELLFRLYGEDTLQDANIFPRIPFIPLADYPNVYKPDCPTTIPL